MRSFPQSSRQHITRISELLFLFRGRAIVIETKFEDFGSAASKCWYDFTCS